MEGVTASGATATAKETFGKTINVVVEIFVPVGAAIAGFFMPTVLGGGKSIADAMYRAQGGSGSGSIANRVAWAVQALINAAVGGAFWTLRHHANVIAKAIGGAIGGFFLGSAVGCLPGLLSGNQPTSGVIDSLATSVQSIAAEG